MLSGCSYADVAKLVYAIDLGDVTLGKVFDMKKSVWTLVASIVQIVIGVLGIAAYFILEIGGEEMTKWIPALILCITFVVRGFFDIKEYKSKCDE